MSNNKRWSVVKVISVTRSPNYFEPWKPGKERVQEGSGCIIDPRRILTHSDLVTHATHVEVAKPGDLLRFEAYLIHVDHDRELAILGVRDDAFFADALAYTLSDSKEPGTAIRLCGFRHGTQQASEVEGQIIGSYSRVYANSQRFLPALHTDLSPDKGFTGGPVFAHDGLVGLLVKAQRNRDLLRQAYVIPSCVVRGFFNDLSDDAIGGVPDLGIQWQKTESSALRKYLGLSEREPGILVSDVLYRSSTFGVLARGDLLTHVGDTPIRQDGSCVVSGRREHFTAAISRCQLGEEINIRGVRERNAFSAAIRLKQYVALVPLPKPQEAPRYLIWAGFVFVPLTHEYVAMAGRGNAFYRFLFYVYDRLPSEHRTEIVIISHVLEHESNTPYHDLSGAIVSTVNGHPIASLKELADRLDAHNESFQVVGLENHRPRSESHVYDLPSGDMIVLGAAEARTATRNVLATHNIGADRSSEL